MSKSRDRETSPSLEPEIDALFGLPLAEFTSARNALAARLKKSGQREQAESVLRLSKPSVTAWAVNQVYRHHRPAFERLLATGRQFYDAQLAQLSGTKSDIRSALGARRESLSEVARLAAAALESAGSHATPDLMRRITSTLEALSTAADGDDWTPGRLVHDLSPSGFEVLAPLVSRSRETPRDPADGPSRVLPFRETPARGRAKKTAPPDEEPGRKEAALRAAREKARAAVAEAEQRVREWAKATREAEASLRKVAIRTKDADRTKEEAERRLMEAAAAADEAHAEARRIATGAEEAAQALDEAERAVEQARQHLASLES